jgi:hypothetical protein
VHTKGFKKHVRHVASPSFVHLAGAGGLVHKFKNGLARAKFAKRKDWEHYLASAFVYVNGEKTPLKSVCDIHQDRTDPA